jgi:hypothetical protein
LGALMKKSKRSKMFKSSCCNSSDTIVPASAKYH